MLVVLVLIALLSGAITIRSRPDPRAALRREAQRIGLLMGIAMDEARLRREPVDWEANLRGYRFVLESDNERSRFAADEMLRARSWETPLARLAVTDLASGTTRVLLDPSAPALRVATGREWVQPRWRLELATDQASVAVEFDASGHASDVH